VVADLSYVRNVPPTVNEAISTAMVEAAADRVLGTDAVVAAPQSLGGEDFAWYLHLVPGAMARLGTRTPGALAAGDLHQPTFDIDERAIGVGVRVLAALTARGDEPPYPHKAAEYVGGPGDSPPPAD
jgi:metal-dependent amidase/aminoacylase/carboxypeptidase family protein